MSPHRRCTVRFCSPRPRTVSTATRGAICGVVVGLIGGGATGGSCLVQADATPMLSESDSAVSHGVLATQRDCGESQHSILHRILDSTNLICRAGWLSFLGCSLFTPSLLLWVSDSLPIVRVLVPFWLREAAWCYILWTIEVAGPTFIKLAQWAASRPDMFSTDFCLHFAKLHDDTTPHAWKHTAQCLQYNLGTLFPGYTHSSSNWLQQFTIVRALSYHFCRTSLGTAISVGPSGYWLWLHCPGL